MYPTLFPKKEINFQPEGSYIATPTPLIVSEPQDKLE